MNTLFINACVRDGSRTLTLARELLAQLDGPVTEVNLKTHPVMPLTQQTLARREALVSAGVWDDPMLHNARLFAQAEQIVIAAPYWDLSFPALLKAYLESVCVSGVTFQYVDGVPRSLCRAKRLIYITTAGGTIFADLGFEYVKALAKAFFAIAEVHSIRATRLDECPDAVPVLMAQASAEIAALCKTLNQ